MCVCVFCTNYLSPLSTRVASIFRFFLSHMCMLLLFFAQYTSNQIHFKWSTNQKGIVVIVMNILAKWMRSMTTACIWHFSRSLKCTFENAQRIQRKYCIIKDFVLFTAFWVAFVWRSISFPHHITLEWTCPKNRFSQTNTVMKSCHFRWIKPPRSLCVITLAWFATHSILFSAKYCVMLH